MLSQHDWGRGHPLLVKFEVLGEPHSGVPKWFPRFEEATDFDDRNILHMSVAFDRDVERLSKEEHACFDHCVESLLNDPSWNGQTAWATRMSLACGHGNCSLSGFRDPKLTWLYGPGSYSGKAEFGHSSPYYGGPYARLFLFAAERVRSDAQNTPGALWIELIQTETEFSGEVDMLSNLV